MDFHNYCTLFPEMAPDEFDHLMGSVRANGLRDKIVTFNGKILEGRNRFNACAAVNVKPTFEKFKGTEKEALEFVIDKNFNRRHLTTGQKANLAVEFATCRNSDTSLSEAAKKFGVSRDTVQTAARIKKVSKKLSKQVAKGSISLNAAKKKADIISPPISRPRISHDPADFYTTRKPSSEPVKSAGQICCEAYYAKLKNKAVKWDELPDAEKWAWQAGADSVKGRI